MGDVVYDIVVIGAGMIGSAAARYVSTHRDLKVCVIGPEEAKERKVDDGRDIYGAHYDEARITNSVQYDPIWAQLASRSIQVYRYLENLSGIKFYKEVGTLRILAKDGTVLKDTQQAALAAGQQTKVLPDTEANTKYPYVYFSKDEQILEQERAGYINPRLMIEAELSVAKNNGCHVIRDIVSQVIYPTDSKDPLRLHTDLGNVIHCKKVIIATGAFTSQRKLLPSDLNPNMKLITQSVVYAETSAKDLEIMSNMPSIIKTSEPSGDNATDCYILPPVQYPDGKYYLKLGHGSQFDEELPANMLKQWYCQDVPKHIMSGLVKTLSTVFPDFKPLSVSGDTCATTRTENRRLFLDLISPRVCIAIAGNGYAAKCCDYIGKMASDLIVSGKWESDLPQNWFRFKSLKSKL